jgi:Protein of unknown function (DUF4242)
VGFLAEFYLPEHDADLADLARRARAAAAAVNRRGSAVTFVRAMYAAADESCFVVYEADSAAAVLAAGQAAGMAFDRVVQINSSEAG